jgi:hypothetical protein
LVPPDRGRAVPRGAVAPLATQGLGAIGEWLQSTVDFLREDDYLKHYKDLQPDRTRKAEEPYASIMPLYEEAAADPDDERMIDGVAERFRQLQLASPGCSRNINLTLKPTCEGVKASLYFTLHDIRDSVRQSLQPPVAGGAPEVAGPQRPLPPESNQERGLGGLNALRPREDDFADSESVE